MNAQETHHKPVLLSEVLDYMRAEQGGHFLDCTFGGGGHTRALLEMHPETVVTACDRDPAALSRGASLEKEFTPRLTLRELRFSELSESLPEGQFDGLLADLGMSTDHLKGERGFAFDDDKLDMRMDSRLERTAQEIVNAAPVGELRRMLRRGGVGKEAGPLAAAIVNGRPFDSARQLADCVAYATPHYLRGKTHPATVVFQALRIEVNEEFAEIEALLDSALSLVKSGGRLVFICFHSLEDKLVTKHLRRLSRSDAPALLDQFSTMSSQVSGKLLTSRAVRASEEEVQRLPSARSALLRAFEVF